MMKIGAFEIAEPVPELKNSLAFVLKLLDQLFGLAVDLEHVRGMGEQLYKKLDQAVASNPQAKEMVGVLERSYDGELVEKEPSEPPHALSPEVEKFLKDIGKQFGSN